MATRDIDEVQLQEVCIDAPAADPGASKHTPVRFGAMFFSEYEHVRMGY